MILVSGFFFKCFPLMVYDSKFSSLSYADKVHNCSRGWNPLMGSCGSNLKLGEDVQGGNGGSVVNRSHCSTIERLYAWEKKLHKEVKVLILTNI